MAQANEIGQEGKAKNPGGLARSSRASLAAIVLLVTLAGAAVGLDMLAWRGRKAQEIRTFQKAVGGLGMGAIATPLWQFINFDGRIFSVDDSLTWPVPGGYSCGPDRTGAVSYFEEKPEGRWTIRRW